MVVDYYASSTAAVQRNLLVVFLWIDILYAGKFSSYLFVTLYTFHKIPLILFYDVMLYFVVKPLYFFCENILAFALTLITITIILAFGKISTVDS